MVDLRGISAKLALPGALDRVVAYGGLVRILSFMCFSFLAGREFMYGGIICNSGVHHALVKPSGPRNVNCTSVSLVSAAVDLHDHLLCLKGILRCLEKGTHANEVYRIGTIITILAEPLELYG